MRLLFCLIALTVCQLAFAQYRIIGFVYDAAEEPFIGTEVRLTGGEERMTTHTDEEGRFEFHNIARGEYKVLVITDYGLIEKDLNVRTSLELHLQRSRNVKLDEVVVSAVRASSENDPIVKTDLDKEEITVRNLGQDVPFILKWTPSVVTTSDAGTGIGYTGMRVRGIDPTRINVTINGVPLNDAESQGVFWVDLPDFAATTQSIQVQRGVGESTFGTGAFGATINLNTNHTNIHPYGKVEAGIGSFGTYRGNVQFGTGLLGNHVTIDGRVSTIQSDGYIDRASADLRSYFGSAAYISGKTSIRFTSFGGKEVTYQAWNGVPAQYIDDPDLRTFNTAGDERPGEPYDNEVDDYTQTHYQLHINQSIFTQLEGYLTAHYTKGKGFFEQYKGVAGYSSDPAYLSYLAMFGLDEDDSVRRRWLDNDFYGFIAGLHYSDPSDKATFRLSGGYNIYKGDHFGEVIWSASGQETEDLPYYYANDAVKKSGNVFGKLNYRFSSKWYGYFDLQYRGVNYTFEGLDADGTPLEQSVSLKFFNPKLGVVFMPQENWQLSFYSGIGNREPNREDYTSSTASSRPRPERLYDNELMLKYQNERLSFDVTGYYMHYKDQLAVTGRLNDVGEYTRVNVDQSYRLGLELNVAYQPIQRLDLAASLTFSQNRVREFDEYIDDWDNYPAQIVETHRDVPLAFSPSTLVSGQIGYQFLALDRHAATIGWLTKYVGEQYVDNSGRDASRFDAYTFTDIQLMYTFKWKEGKSVGINFLVRNVFDAMYESNAWNYRFMSESYDPTPDDPYTESEGGGLYHQRGFYPQAGTNFLLGVTLSI